MFDKLMNREELEMPCDGTSVNKDIDIGKDGKSITVIKVKKLRAPDVIDEDELEMPRDKTDVYKEAPEYDEADIDNELIERKIMELYKLLKGK